MTLPRFPKPLLAWAITLLALGAVAVAIRAVAPDYATVRAGRADAGYLESGDCRKCHETNYTSWHATFHRTMTQEAGPESILGDFERENTITYQGVRTEMVRENGAYWMKFTGVDGKNATARNRAHRRFPANPAVSDEDRRYLVSPAHRVRSGPAPLDAPEWIVLLSRWNRLQPARRGMECELRLLPQREGPARPQLGQQNVEDGGGRTGHRLWRLSRTGGRACATRSFSRHAISLAIERANRAGPISRPTQPSSTRIVRR